MLKTVLIPLDGTPESADVLPDGPPRPASQDAQVRACTRVATKLIVSSRSLNRARKLAGLLGSERATTPGHPGRVLTDQAARLLPVVW
jgi:hypothetical protein